LLNLLNGMRANRQPRRGESGGESESPRSALGDVAASPPPTQAERVARSYAGCAPAARPSPYAPGASRNPVPAPAAEVASQTAERDAVSRATTRTQQVARTYAGPSSETIAQASPVRAAFLERARERGVDRVDAEKALSAFLAIGDEPSR